MREWISRNGKHYLVRERKPAMKAINKPLPDLTAADVMSREVVVVSDEMSLQDAAHLLVGQQISGAPAVNTKGCCVGVLSATDYFRWVEDENSEITPTHEVNTLMSVDPVTVPPTKPVKDLARMMIDGHIHRVIVVDEQKRPIGVVSSTDILAVIASAKEKRR